MRETLEILSEVRSTRVTVHFKSEAQLSRLMVCSAIPRRLWKA